MQDSGQSHPAWRALLSHPATGGGLLLVAVILAMAASNTSLDPYYDALLAVPLSVRAS